MSQPAARRAFATHDRLRQEVAAADGDFADHQVWSFVSAVHDLLASPDVELVGDADRLRKAAMAVIQRMAAIQQ